MTEAAADRTEFGYLRGLVLSVGVLGEPVPQGSIRSLGRGRPAQHSNKERLAPWRSHVQATIETAIERCVQRPAFPLEGPVAVEVTFTVRKPKSAPKRRRTFPAARPDVDKLLRGVLDAATAAGVFGDDAQVVEATARKVYPLEHPQALTVPGVYVLVYQVSD